jgi:hypothetical protein
MTSQIDHQQSAMTMRDKTFQQLRESLLAGIGPEEILERFELSELTSEQQDTLALDLEIGGLLASGSGEFKIAPPVAAAQLRRNWPLVPLGLTFALVLVVAGAWLALHSRSAVEAGPVFSAPGMEYRAFVAGNRELPGELARGNYQRARQVAALIARDAAGSLQDPQPLVPGVLELREGTVALAFPDVALVHIQAPAKLEVLGPGAAYLHRGNVAVEDLGQGGHFTLWHAGGKIVDIGTAFAVRITTENEVDLYVQEGIVDVYNSGEPRLGRLREGQLFASSAEATTIERPTSPPGWVVQRFVSAPAGKVQRPVPVQSVTWLQGKSNTGKAAGSLGAAALRMDSVAIANGGAICPIDWCQHLAELTRAESWYHQESAAVGAPGCKGDHPAVAPATVHFDAKIVDPILLFAWGEAGLRVDLRELDVAANGIFVSHPSITFKDGIIDFGDEAGRQNIPQQAIAVCVKGTFGEDRPLRFRLHNSLPRAESVAFSVAVRSEGAAGASVGQ